MLRYAFIRLIPVLAGLALAGCETLAPRVAGEDPAAWEARRATLEAMDKWSLEGRLAVKANDEGQSANVSWKQEGEFLEARFFGPFGAGNTRIVGNADELLIETSDGERMHTTTPERDLYRELGWTVPLDRMPYWVRGIPGPGLVEDLKIDGAGRLQSVKQGTWTLEIPQYVQREDGRVMPRRITLNRRDVRIRLIIDDWKLPAGEPTAAIAEELPEKP